MDQEDTFNWLPAAWMKVFTTEQPDFYHYGVTGAERRLLNAEAANGSHGNLAAFPSRPSSSHPLPDWFSLLDSLMARQKYHPQMNDELCRFLQLPVHVQRTILGLISHHALEIPLPLLQKFTRDVQDCKLTDHWSLFHLHTLQNYIATHLPEMGQRSKVMSLREGYMSERSKNLFHDVCKVVSSNGSCGQHGSKQDDLPQHLFPEYGGMKCFMECFEESKGASGQIGQGSQDFRNRPDAKMTIPCVPSETQPSKRRSELSAEIDGLEQKQLKVDQRVSVSTSSAGGVLVQPPPVLNGQDLEGITDVDVLPEGMNSLDVVNIEEQAKQTEKISVSEEGGEKSRREDDDTHEPSIDIGDKRSFIDEISDELKSQFYQMKTSWHGDSSLGPSELHGCSEAIKLMGTCTPSQLSEICDYIGLASVTIPVLPAICQCIVPVATHFSFKSSVALAEKLFLGKMSALTHNPPRVLTTSLTDFAKTFPKPAIEGVLTPCLITHGSTPFQVDLVSKVAKEALTVDLRSYLLRNVLAHPDFVWSESFSGFVQGLIDTKLELDSSLLGLLTSSLAENAATQARCKKFAKLLLATINKFSKQLTHNHVTSLQRSVEVNQTFLKKACQNALKKVKL